MKQLQISALKHSVSNIFHFLQNEIYEHNLMAKVNSTSTKRLNIPKHVHKENEVNNLTRFNLENWKHHDHGMLHSINKWRSDIYMKL